VAALDPLPTVKEGRMSVADVAPETAPFVSDYVPGTVGHVILAVGRDHSGTDAVAIWQVSPTGQPTGAWILATADGGDPAKAQRLLTVVERRSVFGWDAATAADALARIAAVAGVPAPVPRDGTAVYLPEVLAEIADHRRMHAAAVDEHQAAAKSKVAPLTYQRDVPTGAGSPAELVALAGLGEPGTPSEVADRALLGARLLAWTSGLWQDTEQMRLRRRYLVERFGPASPLPPGWLARLRAANAGRVAPPQEAALAGAA
jgi:hypothetical protein